MDESLTLRLRRMLAELKKSDSGFAAKMARHRRGDRKQSTALTVGRIKIDAARAALEDRMAARRKRDQTQ